MDKDIKRQIKKAFHNIKTENHNEKRLYLYLKFRMTMEL